MFIHPSFGALLGGFHLLAITNNAAVNAGVWALIWMYVLSSLGHIRRGGIPGSCLTLHFTG